MRGLIIKDLYTIKRYSKMLLALVVLYAMIGFGMRNLNYIIYMIPFLTLLSVVSTFSYDEFVNWDKYALSMPINKKDMVLSKYVLTLILILVSGVFSAVLLLALNIVYSGADVKEMLYGLIGVMAASLLLVSVFIPLTYKFGCEKGRIIFPIMVIVPSFGIPFIMKNIGISFPSEDSILLLIKIFPILAIILIIISYFIALQIYKKKEW